MAVPKKRVSRTRKLLRNNQWKLQIRPQALKALSLAKSVERGGLPSPPENTSPNDES
uniref:Large ribosomal subunit protein bL32c n=1 Tax=Monomastix sp. (strain OKE-1) TaxID=141716 RepID=C0JWQ9_MONSK|nr:ribosomal protein L32 [Monomastix sp. OKE-1]ACK36915.1 ribosomal protein L32 [Monomastix sp. OKE-1]